MASFKHIVATTICCLAIGCASNRAVENAQTERVNAARVDSTQKELDKIEFATSLEIDLLLGLWIHLGDEQLRLKRKLSETDSSTEKQVIQTFLGDVTKQRDQVFRTIFSND